MKRFHDHNLTDEEWAEVFDFPKIFNPGDIVENNSTKAETDGVIWKVVRSLGSNGHEIGYILENLKTGRHGCASSTFIFPIGTFEDDESYKHTVIPVLGFWKRYL